ncbi:TIGR03943 family putative permease subunit [Cohnella panacarvi]|uniref:TIGR03943 family putative permease subunit n=1 Tax=Cohnella panacarvi TaxID=400776 RepID=UPI0004791EBD|nr:TIGR03943 family protein [Cohnella panacarvi]
MNERYRIAHYWIRAGILAALSWYIVHLVKSDKLHLYIVPRMIPYVKFGTLALFAMAAFYAFLAISRSDGNAAEPDCDCGHEPSRSSSRNILMYGLFAIPLLLGFALPDRIMGSEVVAVKGMNLNVATVEQPTEQEEDLSEPSLEQPNEQPTEIPSEKREGESPYHELDKRFPADDYGMDFATLGKRLYPKDTIHVNAEGYLELLTTLDLYKDNFKGKDIVISGFVYREDDMGKDEFVVSRMAMQCCSADATPYGFLVRSDMGSSLNNDTWINMTGTLSTTVYRDNEIIRLEAKKIEVISAPDDPYVYPYYDDFEDLVVD